MQKKLTDTCIICSSKITFVVKQNDKHYGVYDKYFDVYSCNECQLLFLNPMLSDEELFKLYPKDYYIEPKKNFLFIRNGIKIFIHLLYNAKAKDLSKKSFTGLKILDLGVGNGDSMKLIKKKGGDVYGIEVSETLYNLAIKNELNVRFGTLSECNFENESFDYIRSNHSFEHLTNPLDTLYELNRILKPNGELFIGIPNSGSILYKIFKNKWYYFGTPFHPYNYNDKNIKLMLKKAGFKVDKIRYSGNFNGIIGSIQIYFNNRSNQKAFSNNFIFRVIAHQFARIFNLFRTGDCIEVIAKKIKK